MATKTDERFLSPRLDVPPERDEESAVQSLRSE